MAKMVNCPRPTFNLQI